MPKQTRSQRINGNGTTHDIREDLKCYVGELRGLCKNIGIKQDGGRKASTTRLEQARENQVQCQGVGTTTAMTKHQPSRSAFSDSQRQGVLDLLKTATNNAAEAAASQAINSFQQLQSQQSNSVISCEKETTREVNMAS